MVKTGGRHSGTDVVATTSAESHNPTSETTVFVRGLPNTATTADLEKLFADFGPVKQCFIVGNSKNKEIQCAGYGYVNFVLADDARSAVAKSGNLYIADNVLSVVASRKRDSLETRNNRKRVKENETFNNEKSEKVDSVVFNKKEQKKRKPNDPFKLQPNISHSDSTLPTTSRLIVRNLSFKCDEAKLRAQFECFGSVTECLMPRKTEPDGLYRGFGMVQFAKRSDAATALLAMNEKPICGRQVAVDWCIPQAEYLTTSESVTRKVEAVSKSEENDEDIVDHIQITPPPRRITVDEGTTVFVRGVPPQCENEEPLKTEFSRFGEIDSCSITLDKTTGLPRGSAFVCFTTREAADAAIDAAASKENSIHGNGVVSGASILIPEVPRYIAEAQKKTISTPPSLYGRRLRVDLALAKTDAPSRLSGTYKPFREAEAVSQQPKKKMKRKDKRKTQSRK